MFNNANFKSSEEDMEGAESSFFKLICLSFLAWVYFFDVKCRHQG